MSVPVSKATFRGTIVVLFALIIIFILPDIITWFSPADKMELSFADREKREFARKFRQNKQRSFKRNESRYHTPIAAFDPNAYTLEDWMSLGLSEKQAASLMKFALRGLRSDEDLKKSFIMSDELFALIKDSTFYPEMPAKTFEANYQKTAEKIRIVNLNAATEEELMTVKGIGAFFARNIIRRREQLGGFHSQLQLLEVWKMDEEKLNLISPGIFIDGKVKKININTATVEDFKKHPYFNYSIANSLVKLRAQHGDFKTIEGVKKSVLITGEIFEKIKPYITVG